MTAFPSSNRFHTGAEMKKRFVLGLLLLAPGLVFCGDLEETEEDPPPMPAIYEFQFGCDSDDIEIVVDDSSDATDPADTCFGQDDILSVTENVAGSDVTVTYGTGNSEFETYIKCAYDISSDLVDPATCSGTSVREFEFFYAFGTDRQTVRFSANALELGSEPMGALMGTVTVECPNDTARDVPLGQSVDIPVALPLSNGSCVVTIDIDSEASAAGATYHTISVIATMQENDCENDLQCQTGERCGPAGCQAGDEGDSCRSPYLPMTGGGDCGSAAPICLNLGFSGECQDGDAGDPCHSDVDCAVPLTCGGLFPTCM